MLFLGMGRVFAQKIIEFQVVETVVSLPIVLDQATQTLEPLSRRLIISSDQGSQRTPAQRLLSHQQHAENGLEHHTPLLPIALETVDRKREEVIGIIGDAANHCFRIKGFLLGQLLGHQIQIECILFHRLIETVSQWWIEGHTAMLQNQIEVTTTKIGQLILTALFEQFQRFQSIVGTRPQHKHNALRRVEW